MYTSSHEAEKLSGEKNIIVPFLQVTMYILVKQLNIYPISKCQLTQVNKK